MIKILHAADFHLDSPFESLPPEKAKECRSLQRSVIDHIIDLAESQSSDLILLSGDLFDSDKAYYETTQQLISALGRTKINVFISPGNHDYYSPRSPYGSLDWPSNVHIFRRETIEQITLPELDCTVYGAAFVSNRCSSSLLTGFTTADRSKINIMVLHGETEGAQRNYNPISTQDILASGLDYIALGHIHAFSGIKTAGTTAYAYPGCPQGRGFDETGDKGVIIGLVGKGMTKLQFVPVSERRYGILNIDVGGFPSAAQAVIERIRPDFINDIFRIVLTGESDFGVIDTDTVLSDIGNYFYQVYVRDSTRIRRGLWDQAGEDTLKGLFLSRLKKLFDSSQDAEEKERIELAVRYGLAALENWDKEPKA